MREPYVELGLAVVGRAILDWREYSRDVAWDTPKSGKLKMIEDFFNGELAELCLSQVDIEPKVILENLKEENLQKRIEHLSGVNFGRENRDD